MESNRPLKRFVTPRTYPLDAETGCFASEVAEEVHQEAVKFGLERHQTRHLIP